MSRHLMSVWEKVWWSFTTAIINIGLKEKPSMFDREMAITCRELYLEDERHSFEMTKARYEKRRKYEKGFHD